MATTITPGGRVGNDASIGSRSNGENWVEQEGGLPRYIRIVRNGLMRQGMSKGKAHAFAIAAIKRWAVGGGDVSPKVQAAAVAALAQWEKMKASANAKGFDTDEFEFKGEHDLVFFSNRSTAQVVKRGEPAKPKKGYGTQTKRKKATAEQEARIAKGEWIQVDENGNEPGDPNYKRTKYRPQLLKKGDGSIICESELVSDTEFKDALTDTVLAELFDSIDSTEETKDDAAMPKMEHKQAGSVTGLNVVDEKKGIVEAFVSVTGMRDNVKDIIEPGAYEKTLITRKPKGVYAHDWKIPVAKALDVKELMPGDPGLPSHLPNGEPWPSGSGALWVKAQFNLKTDDGRRAFENVVFYGDEQEWSIGYQVPAGAARMDSKTGIRHIDYLELYEFSPVLFGAMPAARTSSVKDALSGMDFHDMSDVEFKNFCDQHGLELKGKMGCDCDDPDCNDPSAHVKAEDEDTEVKGRYKGHDPEGSGDHAHRDEDEAEDWSDDEDDDEEEKALFDIVPSAYEYDVLVKARDTIDILLDQADFQYVEEQKGLADIVAAHSRSLGDYAEELKDAAEAFDTSFDLNDIDGLNDFGDELLTIIEKGLEESAEDNALVSALQKVAAGVASMAPDEEEEDDAPLDEDDVEKKKPLPPRQKKADVVEFEVKDFEALRVGLLNNRLR